MEPAEEFNRLVGDITFPLYVVTVAAGGEKDGCVVGFATQCSISPPRFVVCLSVKNRTFRLAAQATHLGVHVLGRAHKDLAELFGGDTGDEVDKFAAVAWHDGPEGVPLIDAVDAWFVGRVIDRMDLGDHVGHVLEPVAARAAPTDNFTSDDAGDIEAGHPATG